MANRPVLQTLLVQNVEVSHMTGFIVSLLKYNKTLSSFRDDVEQIEDKIYMFSSPPKSAPRHMTNNYVGGSISGGSSDKKVKSVAMTGNSIPFSHITIMLTKDFFIFDKTFCCKNVIVYLAPHIKRLATKRSLKDIN